MSSNKETNRVIPEEWVLPNKKEFIEWVNQTFIKYRTDNTVEESVKGVFKPFKYQKFLRDYMTNKSPYRGILLYQSTGSGKCVEKGTPIIMYDGSIKKVEDIVEDDLLMGDDSTPRKVTSLARGFDKMYEVKQSCGNKYTVNSEHILCLKVNNYPSIHYNHKYNTIKWIENNQFCVNKIKDLNEAQLFYKNILNNLLTNNNVIEISIKDYLKLSNNKKKQMKGYRVPIEFKEQYTPIDPYMMGYWLGTDNKEDELLCETSDQIPHIYKCNSRNNRLKLLAGLLDSNINISKNFSTLMITNNNKKLFDDILYLIRSLGIGLKIINNNSLYVFGKEIEEIPLITPIKRLLGDKYNKIINHNNYLLSNIDVKYVRNDNYYGFTLDGNCRFLFGDFTVTHNTCTSIEIAENLKTERNIVVMLPASLRNNFITDGLLFCGNPQYKENPEMIKEHYSFISYNANNTVTQIKRIGSLDNKVIIIDEVHNLVSKMMNGLRGTSKQGLDIYNYLMNAQNAKIIAMSGTPIINDPFETAVLFNILKGYIEINNFRIISVSKSYGNKWNFDDLERELLSNKLIDFLEINKINKSIEFHFNVMSYDDNYRELLKFIQNKCYENGVEVRFLNMKRLSLFPVEDQGEVFKNNFVKENTEKGDQLKNEHVFKKRLLGLVSYYKPPNENFPTVKHNDYFRVEMSNYQFQMYEILRSKERLSERSGDSKSKSVKSTFRVFSRQVCNFVFPEEILRPYPNPNFIVTLKKNNKTKNNKTKNLNIDFNKLLEMEDKANDGNIHKEYKKRIDKAIKKIVENGTVYLKPGIEGLDKLSPKMRVMLNNINNSPGLVFVYSNFRTLEGIEIFSKVLDFNGYQKFNPLHPNDDIPKYAIYSGTEDEEERKETLKIFTSSENKYGKLIKIVLATSAGAEGLDLKNIRQIHIMEPYWNQVRNEQVIGRGVRRNSHIELPPKDRNVEIFRYFSVFSKDDGMLTRDKMSTDEYIEQVSIKKQVIINEILQSIKEISVDCFLNKSGIKGKYNCFSFGKGAKGISYFPTISKDLIESSSVQNKKIVKKVLKKGILTEDRSIYLYEPKKGFYLYHNKNMEAVELDKGIKKKPILVDKNSNEIYDIKNINNGSHNPIGYINKNGKFTRRRI